MPVVIAMKRPVFLIKLFFVFVFFFSCDKKTPAIPDTVLSEVSENGIVASKDTVATTFRTTDFDYFPTSTTGVVINHEAYSFSYAEPYEQAEWVAYTLTKDDLSNRDFKRPLFTEDKDVKSGSASWRNYKQSGYDKGHLCPAGDRKKNYKMFEETFLTSNISPQLHHFNDGVWNRLEQKVRYWATKYDGLYVVTGGVLSENLKTIGKENVAVPNYFYKVLMTQKGDKMIGFLVPHAVSDRPLYEFVVDVDTIEKLTGIDFFPQLPDAIENKFEKNSDYKAWSFN
ncbi:DNA/RNA non-specific endonuclease [Flavobacterium supellecticarium]|nr:DNA/RNA non-specific endonuclease [Flavobacterium supellecticarium]